MKTQTEIEQALEVMKALRSEIAEQYKQSQAYPEWQIERIKEKWYRKDEAISVLKWVLENEVNVAP